MPAADRLILDGATAGLILHDASFRFLGVNQRASELLGYPRDALERMGLGDIEPDFDAHGIRTILGAMAPGEVRTVRGAPRHAEGSPIEVRVDVRRLPQEPPLFVATITPIEVAGTTDQRRFLRSVSHELLTPLHAVLGFTELIRDRTEDPVVGGWADHVQLAARHMRTMVGDLLRLRSLGEGTDRHQRVDLAALTRGAVGLALGEAPTRTVAIEPSEGPNTAWADPVAVQQILLNLLNNALRFSRDTIVVRVGPGRIEVQDDGEGVAAGLGDRIFDYGTRSQSNGGSGIGLATARALANSMGGQLTMQPVPAGARFVLRLPEHRP